MHLQEQEGENIDFLTESILENTVNCHTKMRSIRVSPECIWRLTLHNITLHYITLHNTFHIAIHPALFHANNCMETSDVIIPKLIAMLSLTNKFDCQNEEKKIRLPYIYIIIYKYMINIHKYHVFKKLWAEVEISQQRILDFHFA